MASQAHLDKMQLRQNYRNLWHTDLMRTMQNDPPWLLIVACRFGVGPVCRICFGKEHFTMTCPGMCVAQAIFLAAAAVVFLCFGNSVASTRFLLQDEFNIQTTQCDNCIIWRNSGG